jgi:predicted AlkP superfamily phosphohydrolase/phosphomutase
MGKNRVIVIGVDGATFKIIRPLIKDGRLPNLSRLMAEGVHGELLSSVPTVSPVAWTSLMTGVRPDRHGIFDFSGKVRGTHDFRINTARERTAEPVWMNLSRQDKRVFVFGVTQTYPPDPVNGYMVSGLGAPQGRPMATFSHPPGFGEEISSLFGEFKSVPDVNFRTLTTSDREKEKYLKSVVAAADYQLRVFEHVWAKEHFDFSMLFYLDTDGTSHYFWKYMDPAHSQYSPGPYADAIQRVYEKVDEGIGKLLKIVGDDTDLIIVSDHGFGPLNRVVFLNNWLASKGYLAFGRKTSALAEFAGKVAGKLGVRGMKAGRRIEWGKTRAYSSGTVANIFINLKGREPDGIVPAESYDAICKEIAAEIALLEDPATGRKIVERVHTARELCREAVPHPTAPDLHVEFKKGYAAIGDEIGLHNLKDRGEVICDSGNWSGVHEPEGVFMAFGPRFRKGAIVEGARLIDVAPTTLYLLGAPVPENMDGKILTTAFTDEFLRSNPVLHSKDEAPQKQDQPPVRPDEEENAEMMERLRNLGYIE